MFLRLRAQIGNWVGGGVGTGTGTCDTDPRHCVYTWYVIDIPTCDQSRFHVFAVAIVIIAFTHIKYLHAQTAP